MNETDGSARAEETADGGVRFYSRVIALLLFLTIVGGYFGEVYVPSKIVIAADANATAQNIRDMEGLFRLGFAAYLLEGLSDAALAAFFYLLLRPVRRDLALVAAFLGLVSVSVFAVTQLSYFNARLPLLESEYLKTFSPEQLNTLSLLMVKLYTNSHGLFMAFYGIPAVLRGYLIYRSGFLPKIIGMLFMVAGSGFIANNFIKVLAPDLSSPVLVAPMGIAVVSLFLWLLIRGVDEPAWRERAMRAGLVAPTPVARITER
jgi:hypothetical protein